MIRGFSMKKYVFCFSLSFFVFSCTKTSPEKTAQVSFENLKDGDVVKQTFPVKFSVKGMTVLPAGKDVNDKTSGHHHILIDNPKGYIPAGEIVPADDKNIHYGKGQTKGEITLSPGKHKLSLQFADGAHKSYGKALSRSIHVTVK